VGPVILRLAGYLWDSQSVPSTEVIDGVWGETSSGNVLKTNLTRLNRFLLELGVPWDYHLRGELVVKESFGK
jgi:hypothetical protein